MFADVSELGDCRSREGAWIEILPLTFGRRILGDSRSREGAWIEIVFVRLAGCNLRCRSREGAWIEMSATTLL